MYDDSYIRSNASGATRAWMMRRCPTPKCAALSALAAKADTGGSVSPHVSRYLQGLGREAVVQGIHIAGSIDPVCLVTAACRTARCLTRWTACPGYVSIFE